MHLLSGLMEYAIFGGDIILLLQLEMNIKTHGLEEKTTVKSLVAFDDYLPFCYYAVAGSGYFNILGPSPNTQWFHHDRFIRYSIAAL